MKSTFSLISFLVIITFTSAKAQYNYAGAAARIVTTQSMQHFNRMQLNQVMNMSMRSRAAVLNNPKADYKVILTDGTEKTVQSKMEFDKNNKGYLIFVDKNYKKNDSLRFQKIWPENTKSVSKFSTFDQINIKGTPADSCWLFKTVTGKLNAYSFLPESQYLDFNYLKYIQQGNGPLQKIDEATLGILLADNEKAMKLYDKKKYIQAIKAYNK